MQYQHKLPKRVRVLILGGGIHGVGLLHDLASRGIDDTFLIEKGTLAQGTSSRSTKLIHGGLRYLKRVGDFNLVSESLRERRLLLDLVPDLVSPLEFYFPILKEGGEKALAVKLGLSLYDQLAGKQKIASHSYVDFNSLRQNAPRMDSQLFSKIYSFWDAQADDWRLVQRVAASAVAQGASLSEGCRAMEIRKTDDGWIVDVEKINGERDSISALYVINCLGPWSDKLLETSGLKPQELGIKNKGVHLILPDLGHKVGMFLQSPQDKRIFFLLPWEGHTLLGTTESPFDGDPDQVSVLDEDVEYLLERCNRFLIKPFTKTDVLASFAGLRWLAGEKSRSLSSTSRELVFGEHRSERGFLITLYGGKLTSYRSLAKRLGDKICRHFGEFRPSQTHDPKYWLTPGRHKILDQALLERFRNIG